MTRPHITAVVPTRERADVLPWALKTLTSQNYDRLAILVCDNDSRDDTRAVVESIADPRITYVDTGRRLDMSRNWAFALSQVDDGWVTIVGDDDGLVQDALPDVVDAVDFDAVDLVRSPPCNYRWPSSGGTDALLRVPLGHGVAMRDTRTWLRKVMQGRAHYYELPLIYNGGFVRAELLKRLKARGPLVRSCNPDLYFGMALASFADRYAFVGRPLAIAGSSHHSTGRSFQKAAKDGDTPAARYLTEENLPYHPDVPLRSDGLYPRALQAMVYESYLQSAPLRSEAVPEFDAESQLAIVLASGPDREILDWARRFAALHGLDFEEARRTRSTVAKVRRLSGGLRRVTQNYELYGDDVPLPNVYQASIAARTVVRSSPGPVKRAQSAVKWVRRWANGGLR